MRRFLAAIVGLVLVFPAISVSPGYAVYGPDEDLVIEKVNANGFTFTEQGLPGGYGTRGSAFLLSNCPRKGCVTLSGTYRISGEPYATALSVDAGECRPTLKAVEINGMWSQQIDLVVPAGPACAGALQQASGRYFPICGWVAPYGELSWTGLHKNYRCWSADTDEPFPVGQYRGTK